MVYCFIGVYWDCVCVRRSLNTLFVCLACVFNFMEMWSFYFIYLLSSSFFILKRRERAEFSGKQRGCRQWKKKFLFWKFHILFFLCLGFRKLLFIGNLRFDYFFRTMLIGWRIDTAIFSRKLSRNGIKKI